MCRVEPSATRIDDANKAKTPIDRRRVRLLVVDLLCALAECHNFVLGGLSRPILHRDVTPGNIMVLGEPGAERISLIDFGLCRVGSRKGTESGVALGTYSYFSPEHFHGSPDDHTPAMDVFSAAIVMRDLLTAGTAAPQHKTAWFMAATSPDYDPREHLADVDVSESILEVLAKALAAKPSERYEHAGAMRAALEVAWPEEAASSPCEELARWHWEELTGRRHGAGQTVVTRPQLESLRRAMDRIDAIVGCVEQRSAEIQQRIRTAIETIDLVLAAPKDERVRDELLTNQATYQTLLQEMCHNLPSRDFDDANARLLDALQRRDFELFSDECSVIRASLRVAQRRKLQAISPAEIQQRTAEIRSRREHDDAQTGAMRREVTRWYELWSRQLSAWEQQFRAVTRDFHAFAYAVSRIQGHSPIDAQARDDILTCTKSEPDAELKKLFRVYIRRVHPDLAVVARDVEARERLTRMLNEAYDRRDLQMLKVVICEIELAGREADVMDDDASLALELNSLRRMLRSCVQMLKEHDQMMRSDMYALWCDARSAGVDAFKVVQEYLAPHKEIGDP